MHFLKLTLAIAGFLTSSVYPALSEVSAAANNTNIASA
jgi:hypothetical protein